MLTVVARALLGFGLPLAVPVAWIVVMSDRNAVGGMKGGALAQAIWLIIFFGAPIAGYAFVARPFGRWRDLDRSTWWFCIGLSAVYWLIYIPMILVWLSVFAIGRAGGI